MESSSQEKLLLVQNTVLLCGEELRQIKESSNSPEPGLLTPVTILPATQRLQPFAL